MKCNELSVTIIQTDLIWENKNENLKHFDHLIDGIKENTDLIILPEMFTTGFSMNTTELFDTTQGETLKWLQVKSKSKNAAITGSIIIKENEEFYNRLFFVEPNGEYVTYDKKHTFTLAKEHEHYTAGTEKLIVDYKGWKICPLICYDLRFPVWARNTEDYDLLIYVANWPEKRVAAWDALLKARAIENMCYCIGVNRIGTDGNDFPYVGHSAIYDEVGKRLSTEAFEETFIETKTLSIEKLETTRKKLGFLIDRDQFQLL